MKNEHKQIIRNSRFWMATIAAVAILAIATHGECGELRGKKLAMMASVESIKAGRTSWTARKTDCRAGKIRMEKYLAIFSTSVMGSSTSRPSRSEVEMIPTAVPS